jgi:hypothetical protein
MRPALPNQRQFPVRRRGKKRRLLSMRPEKRPQTIMEQYRYREMMRQPHNHFLWETGEADNPKLGPFTKVVLL